MYFLAPFVGWFVSGTIKFIINYFRYGKEAKSRIGNGGFPSTHTTVMVTPTALIGINEGINSSIFGLAVAATYIVIIDALGVRRAIGEHAKLLNKITTHNSDIELVNKKLRESMGHTRMEVLGGLILGILIAFALSSIPFLR